MYNYERILKDCFWDLNFTADDIKNIVDYEDTTRINMVFEKILLHSTALFQDMEIFNKKQLESLLENYQVPKFNSEYSFRRKNMVEVYFFDKPLLIDELKWVS